MYTPTGFLPTGGEEIEMVPPEGNLDSRWRARRAEMGLPGVADDLLDLLHRPLARVFRRWREERGQTVIVGLQGSQGAGKSTLCSLLPMVLAEEQGLEMAVLALDDIYLGRAQRQRLADEVHPLLLTRGVPGTHDAALGIEILESLKSSDGEEVTIPAFDKGTDDRLGPEASHRLRGPFDIVIFEGWCVGLDDAPDHDWQTPINQLEATEDADGRWRSFIREHLAGDYRDLFARLDRMVMLRAPSWEIVSVWRGKQEAMMKAARGDSATESLDAASLERFLAHYERLTRLTLQRLPERSDVVIELGDDQRPVEIRWPP